MFATLVIVLPSPHSGGELIIRHAGKESTFDSSKESLHHIQYSAFFADCEHEIRTLRSGYRVALIYNLIAQGTSQIYTPADNRTAVQQVLQAIREWSEDEEGPEKLVMLLEHQYCTKSLSFDSLKGSDIATVDTILEATKARDGPRFHAYLGMLKKEECGGGECDNDFEVQEETLELSDIIDPDGDALVFRKLPLEEDEVVPEDALLDHDWDETRVEEATGNEGAMMERWYHHAALIIWPHPKHWDILCANNLGRAIKDALALAETIDDAPLDGEEREDLSLAIEALCAAGAKLSAQAATVAKLVVDFGDVSMAEALLSELPIAAAAEVVVSLGRRFGWSTLAPALTDMLERVCTPSGLADCFNLLLKLSPTAPKPRSDALANLTLMGQALKVNPESTADVPGGSVGTSTEESGSRVKVMATDSNGANGGEMEEGAADEQERATICSGIVPTLVARICKGPDTKTTQCYSYYNKPAVFSLKDESTASAFVRVLEPFGADTWQPATAILVKHTVSSSLASVPELLSRLLDAESSGAPAVTGSTSPEAIGFCRSLSNALTTALLKETDASTAANQSSYYGYKRPTFRKPDFVTSVLKAFHIIRIESSVSQSVAAHFLAVLSLYDLETTLVPAVKQLAWWLGTAAGDAAWYMTLWQGCMDALAGRTKTRPAEPRNWALPATCECACHECRQLVAFCLDPMRTTLELRASKKVKKHVQDSIRSYRLPVVVVPEGFQGGVNVPLVCNKNGSRGVGDELDLKAAAAEKAKFERYVKALEEIRDLGGSVSREHGTNEPIASGNAGVQAGEQHVDKRAKVVIDLGDE